MAHEHQQVFPTAIAGTIQAVTEMLMTRIEIMRRLANRSANPAGNSAFRKRSTSCTTLSATHNGVSKVSRSSGVGSKTIFLVGVEVTRLKFFLFRFDLSLLAPAPTDDFVGDEVTSL